MRFRSIDRPGYTKHGEEYPLKTVRNALWKMVALENLELKVRMLRTTLTKCPDDSLTGRRASDAN